ncbi:MULTISPECIES: hypothetical protein [unclassified Cyanobium]|uniref:hypothetical protein n=1 Tax=unclassified Cyanobium TaxID=2627006 RepID=UPI0020CEE88A|nr:MULTISPECIES: hypothetical protein [unclassified Cyanobium]MCP9835495.1 hypothetical protein [Cyanobium sp. La Preciosa 7G6]MCP9938261.1 hypothetical protein [Cyanobium sp. Aljojuca 7A6]
MAHPSAAQIARLGRQGVALFFVFMLSAELPGQIFHLAQHLIGPGPDAIAETLEHLVVLLVYLLALVCALFLAQQELCRTRHAWARLGLGPAGAVPAALSEA